MTTYVALLRAINVGGKNRLPMPELKALIAAAGCQEVRHYIQSGNVVFRAKPGVASKLCADLPLQIELQFGHKPPVVLRSAEQIASVIKANPWKGLEDHLHVMFLKDAPDGASIARLDGDRSPPDRFLVQGQDIYLHLLNGAGETKLTNAYFDSKLNTIGTVRNWRTVLALAEMMSEVKSR